jgi:N-acetylmuramoyl-L-alanine amidase
MHQFYPTSNWDERPEEVEIDTIVIHSTVLETLNEVLATLSNPERKASCHYVIDKNGIICCLVPENKRAWHSGRSILPNGRIELNDFSIGIELINRNDGYDEYPQLQLNALITLIYDINNRYKINILTSHAAVAIPQGRKSDPLGFPVESLKILEEIGVEIIW